MIIKVNFTEPLYISSTANYDEIMVHIKNKTEFFRANDTSFAELNDNSTSMITKIPP